MSDWIPFVRPLLATIPITTEVIRLDFPAARYLATAPMVLVTVKGGVTEVDWTSVPEAVAGLGEVHTHIELTFPTGSIGLEAVVWVAGS